ncbi:MAG TPA: sulfite exporter TauE/SafE family protein [Fluviicola sp.]|nr:sulfite exporter TauE/SafE family protein [Fluviicola sp.]
MDYLLICMAALIGSGLTLFSGFGLGTILVPVFALFFPIEIAILLTAIVHFLNNGFKLLLVGKHVNWQVALRFGLPAVVFAFWGAYLLEALADFPPVCNYQLFGHLLTVQWVKLIIGFLLVVFAVLELVPAFSKLEVDRKYLPIGGMLSGFFGGLSGNQGALRSVFLLRAGLGKESFIATGVIIACLIDTARMLIYIPPIIKNRESFDFTLLLAASLSAFTGAFVGNKLLKKITVSALKTGVACLLIVFGILLAAGIV